MCRLRIAARRRAVFGRHPCCGCRRAGFPYAGALLAAAASKGRPAKRGRIILRGKAADALPDQRMADLMYEEFRRGEYELSEKPIKGIENWSWGRGKVLEPQELWAGYAYGFHSAAASCFEP